MSESESTASESPPVTLAPPKSVFREYLDTIVICVLILVFARSFVFMQSKIPTESMLDTLLVGDYILVNRFVYGAPGDSPLSWLGQHEIERGDVVVFRYPEDPEVDFVKRVVAVPGDTVQVRSGVVYVNGERTKEPFVLSENRDSLSRYGPITVPQEEYFVLGDNRRNSRDSRVWGNVPRSLIKGKAFCVWFSYEEDRNDHLNTGVKRLKSIAKKFRYFFTRTRWSRIPSLVE